VGHAKTPEVSGAVFLQSVVDGYFLLTKFQTLSGAFVDATLEDVSTKLGFAYKPICRLGSDL
jgi:hypothetical protein